MKHDGTTIQSVYERGARGADATHRTLGLLFGGNSRWFLAYLLSLVLLLLASGIAHSQIVTQQGYQTGNVTYHSSGRVSFDYTDNAGLDHHYDGPGFFNKDKVVSYFDTLDHDGKERMVCYLTNAGCDRDDKNDFMRATGTSFGCSIDNSTKSINGEPENEFSQYVSHEVLCIVDEFTYSTSGLKVKMTWRSETPNEDGALAGQQDGCLTVQTTQAGSGLYHYGKPDVDAAYSGEWYHHIVTCPRSPDDIDGVGRQALVDAPVSQADYQRYFDDTDPGDTDVYNTFDADNDDWCSGDQNCGGADENDDGGTGTGGDGTGSGSGDTDGGGSDGTGNGDGEGDGEGEGEGEGGGDCEENDNFGCGEDEIEIEAEDGENLVTDTINVFDGFGQTSGFLPSSCPGDESVSAMGVSFSISYAPVCDAASMIGGIVYALGAMAGLGVALGGTRT